MAAAVDQCSRKATARAEWWAQLGSRATVLTTHISTPMVSAASDQWLVLLGPGGIWASDFWAMVTITNFCNTYDRPGTMLNIIAINS